jgi:hypothetical protein
MDKKAKKAIRKQRRRSKAQQRARQHFRQMSNMRTDNEHTANMATLDSERHKGCSLLEQVIELFKSVSVPFAHNNGRCPRWIQSRVRKDDWSYKPWNNPNGRRKRIETMKPQAKPVQQCKVEEHLLALNDMKTKVIYMAA